MYDMYPWNRPEDNDDEVAEACRRPSTCATTAVRRSADATLPVW